MIYFVCVKILVAVFKDQVVLEVFPGHFENNRFFLRMQMKYCSEIFI